ncbi:MAG: hypothetical protein L6427_06715, partial [Actinomycetia bacterium]|nr:hypothetical protein [Actinomycetota bacterium]MCG2795542.1 hypothetical protein [Actinomycetes bacterium]
NLPDPSWEKVVVFPAKSRLGHHPSQVLVVHGGYGVTRWFPQEPGFVSEVKTFQIVVEYRCRNGDAGNIGKALVPAVD